MKRKMKKSLVWSTILIFLLTFVACGESEENTHASKSKVMLDLWSDVSFPGDGTKTKAVDLSAYENVNNYTVELTNQAGTVVFSQLYGDMEPQQEVDPGSYTIKAYYGENLAVGYDKLYVAGSEIFTVTEGDTKNISFVCRPANTKVKIVYADNFFNYYSDCTVGFKTKHFDSPFLMNKEDKERELFLKSDAEGEPLLLTFDLKNLDGVSTTPDGFGNQTITVHPKEFVTLTIKPKLIDIEGGKISGITVTVDDGVEVEEIEVTLPDDFLPGEDTEVSNK